MLKYLIKGMLKCETLRFKYTICRQMCSMEVKTFYCRLISGSILKTTQKKPLLAYTKRTKNQKKLDEMNAEKPWQVVDINFGTSDGKEQELLTKMDEEYRNKVRKIHK